MKADELIEKALETYRERGKAYGDSYIRHGKAMGQIFPNGITLNTESDFARFSIFNMIVAKLMRYTSNGNFAGHDDSIHDIGVYAFVLEELDTDEPSPQINLFAGGPSTDAAKCEHVYAKLLNGDMECCACGTVVKYRGQGREPHLKHNWDHAAMQGFQKCTVCGITRKEWEEATR